ncbi:hypothetical protein ACQCSX_04325 [Pseudarthrobacter sp. P1]|uniref:hypothetical protein n=1 Tax=Pseudarthrobacter sp. P1 TaxID=3418418 RepID=UPI003CF9F7FE
MSIQEERVEAAVKAWDHHWGDRYGDDAVDEMGEEVTDALTASDALLTSDAAVERVARALCASEGGRPFDFSPFQDVFTCQARAAIDALLGGGE